jgi:alpha-glucosidase (family GH31 glycosyl hydrolase)
MGLGLALSGVSNTGHDIGGFSGPAPDPELFMPRFSIHSWNDDGRSVEALQALAERLSAQIRGERAHF